MQYLILVARASHGLYTADHIKWHLPPEEGWAMIHADDVLRGERTKWPVESHNASHAERARFDAFRAALRPAPCALPSAPLTLPPS